MFDELKDSIINGNEEKAKELTKKLLGEGRAPGDILNKSLVAGMDVVGQRFKVYEMYLPEVIMSATAMQSAMEVLRPHLAKSESISQGKVIMATIEGDVHDIGKNLVSMMLGGSGFEVVDLGVDVPIAKIIEVAEAKGADLIGISALLTTTMQAMGPTIEMIRKKNKKVKIMVGGSPITQEYADKIGADGFAPDALRAISLAKGLIKKKL